MDFHKAFGTLENWATLQSLANARVDRRYNQFLKNICENVTSTIELHEQTKLLQIKRGLRESDTLSPKQFTLILQNILKRLHLEEREIFIDRENLSHLV